MQSLLEQHNNDVLVCIVSYLPGPDLVHFTNSCKVTYKFYKKYEHIFYHTLCHGEEDLRINDINIVHGIYEPLCQRLKSIKEKSNKSVPPPKQLKDSYLKHVNYKHLYTSYYVFKNTQKWSKPPSSTKIKAGDGPLTVATFLTKYKRGEHSKNSKLTTQEKEMVDAITNDTPMIFCSTLFEKDIRLINVKTKKVWKTFKGHEQNVLDVVPLCINPYQYGSMTPKSSAETILNLMQMHGIQHQSSMFNNRFLSSSSDATIKLWDIMNEKCLSTLRGHTSAIYSIRASADYRNVISASHDQTVRLWDLNNMECLDIGKDHQNIVYQVRYDGCASAVSCGRDGRVFCYDVRSGKIQKVHEFIQSSNPVAVYCIDLCGYRLVSSDKNKKIKFWDLRKSVQCIKEFETESLVNRLAIDEFKCIALSQEGISIYDTNNWNMSHVKMDQLSHYCLGVTMNHIAVGNTTSKEVDILSF